jgi:hypothetical protein
MSDKNTCAKTMSFACSSSSVQKVWIRVRLYETEAPTIPTAEEQIKKVMTHIHKE